MATVDRDPRDPSLMLSNTPYMIGESQESLKEFNRILRKAMDASERFQRTGERIRAEAADVFASFGLTLRSEQVAESNKMEHYAWEPDQVRQVLLENKDLLQQSAHAFMASIRADERTYQVLGLAKAHEVVDEWAEALVRPREFEIKELHRLITLGQPYAGRYKYGFNTIEGSSHVPPAPADAAEGMRELSSWFEVGSGDVALDATVVHAWLVHLHAFDDGNGRLARLLANLALSQGKYPPLIIPAATDRGEYYDALEESDSGNILPLFTLFERLLRRAEHAMSQPDYIEQVLRDRALTSPQRRYSLWQRQVEHFLNALTGELSKRGWRCELQGWPSMGSFAALARASSDGNSWFIKVIDGSGAVQWLLWFGFNTPFYLDVYQQQSPEYPSIFLSVRNHTENAVHPFTPVWDVPHLAFWTQLVLIPAVSKNPARIEERGVWKDLSIESVAKRIAKLLAD